MNRSSVKMLLFASATILLLAFSEVNSQGCSDSECSGGPTDRCFSCGTDCPPTCNNPRPSGACPQVCRINACQCTRGTVRAPNGQCVLPRDCPAQRN